MDHAHFDENDRFILAASFGYGRTVHLKDLLTFMSLDRPFWTWLLSPTSLCRLRVRETLMKSFFEFLKVSQSSYRVGIFTWPVSLESLPLKGHFRESFF